jgi:hypothetical protein
VDVNLAVLIDFENIAAGTEKEGLGRFDVEALMDRLKDKGRILVARSYGDWGRFARFKQELLTCNVTMMELTSHGMQDKNRADIAMVVDCLELAFTRHFVDTFVIVSGDSDFTPLVLKMRELNKKVIGVGTRGSTSRLIINACDEFIFYDTVVKAKKRPERVANASSTRKLPKDKAKAFELLVETLAGLLREDPSPPLASVLKTALVRRLPDYSEEDLGYASFGRFLEAARDAGYLSLHRDQKSGGYRVDRPEDDEAEAPAAEAAPAPKAAPAAGAVPEDAYYPAGAEKWLTPLSAASMSPLAFPTRLALLDALVESVADREEKKRRITIPFVVEDIKRKLRRTHPDLGARGIKEVLGALLTARQLMHKDGAPIRSVNAPFVLGRDSVQLNQTLTELYLRHLIGAGADLSDVATLAELFLGDRDRRREIETTLAWLGTDEGEADAPTTMAGALDELLRDDEPAAEAAPAARPNRREGGRDGGREGGRDGNREGGRDGRASGRRDGRGEGRTDGRGEGRDRREPAREPARPPIRAARPADDLDALLEEGDTSELDALLSDDVPATPAPRAERRPERSDRGDRGDRSGDRRERSDRPERRPERAAAPAADLDFDALLEEDGPPAPLAEGASSLDALLVPDDAAPARKARAPRGKKREEASPEAADPVAAEAPVAEAAPAPVEAPAAEALPPEAGGDEPPAKKPRARSPRKKKTDEAAPADGE